MRKLKSRKVQRLLRFVLPYGRVGIRTRFPDRSSAQPESHTGTPFLLSQEVLQTHNPPGLISHLGSSSLWHFPSTQFTKLGHFLFIIYTNILNYFSSKPKYLFLIYGCKYKAGRAHISQGAILKASRFFQI